MGDDGNSRSQQAFSRDPTAQLLVPPAAADARLAQWRDDACQFLTHGLVRSASAGY